MCIKWLEVLLKCEFKKVILDFNIINFIVLMCTSIKNRSQKVLSNEHFFFFPKNCFYFIKVENWF
ncbi:hypothetical protein DBL02_01200 [Acinetobacter oleivorans]|nr:hypothetical protein DBL02_01200 [Acinetobacter oleivorans]